MQQLHFLRCKNTSNGELKFRKVKNKMLEFSNETIYTELEHNTCTIVLLILHILLLLWTLISCSATCVMVS